MSIRFLAVGTLLQPIEVNRGKRFEWPFSFAETDTGPLDSLAAVTAGEIELKHGDETVVWSLGAEFTIVDDAILLDVDIPSDMSLGLWSFRLSLGEGVGAEADYVILRGKFDVRDVE